MSSRPTGQEYYQQWQKLVPNGYFMFEEAHFNHPARIVYTKLITATSKTVLDVGCGICVDYPRFREAQVIYHGIDVTPAYLELARKTYNMPTEHLHLGNGLSLPFTDKSFDSVYENGMLEHLAPDDWKKVVSEMFRVCKVQTLLIFFIPLRKGTTVYQPQAAWDAFWGHQYGEEDLKSFFSELGTSAQILSPINSLTAYYPPETILVAEKNIGG